MNESVPAMRHLDLRFDPVEDRLALTMRDDARRIDFAVTRRVTRSLLRGIVDLMMRTSPLASRSAPEHRQDVLLFEHMEALGRGRPTVQESAPAATATVRASEGGGTTAAADEMAQSLLVRVDMSLSKEKLNLSLEGRDGVQAGIAMGRDQAHQLLHMLAEKANHAAWDFEETTWLVKRGQVVLSQSGAVS
jgi:hypothetical protein